MHIEFLIEDESGKILMEALIPKLLGESGNPHTWKIHAFKGRGSVPKTIKPNTPVSSRDLLSNLPYILAGYGKTAGIDAVVVVLDTDDDQCTKLLSDIKNMANAVNAPANTLIRLAIEEMEAWYFGDQNALLLAWPQAKKDVLNRYKQDSICGTWEKLADAIYKGGSTKLQREKAAGKVNPGKLKYQWAEEIGPFMDPDNNISPSFIKFREGIRRLIA